MTRKRLNCLSSPSILYVPLLPCFLCFIPSGNLLSSKRSRSQWSAGVLCISLSLQPLQRVTKSELTVTGLAVKSCIFNRILFKETCTFSGKWNYFHCLSQITKQTSTWGHGINSDTETDTKETDSKPARVQYESLGCVSLPWDFQVFACEGKGTQASKIMNLGFPDTDLTFAPSDSGFDWVQGLIRPCKRVRFSLLATWSRREPPPLPFPTLSFPIMKHDCSKTSLLMVPLLITFKTNNVSEAPQLLLFFLYLQLHLGCVYSSSLNMLFHPPFFF